jgi:hypothetical protein
LDLETPQKDGKLTILYLRPLDLSVDETMHSILDAVQKIGAKRLVIDSLAGFEMALAPGFRADFRESLYRMIFALTGIGVTILREPLRRCLNFQRRSVRDLVLEVSVENCKKEAPASLPDWSQEAVSRPPETLRPLRGEPVAVLV